MKALLQPSINYANQSFPLTPVVIAEWQEALGLIGKRPFHTIIPGFVTYQGKPYLTDGGTLILESTTSAETVNALKARGHNVQPSDYYFGGYQAIMRDSNGVYHGASESRKDGQAVGY